MKRTAQTTDDTGMAVLPVQTAELIDIAGSEEYNNDTIYGNE
jgi:hypothetical protein